MTTPTGRTITFELPLPPAELNPNARAVETAHGRRALHWSDRAAFAREYREFCGRVAQSAVRVAGIPWPPLERATLNLVFTYCGRRRLDADNCVSSAKSAIDGALVDAGLIVNDSAKRLQLGHVEVRQARHSKHAAGACPAGVRVTLSEVG